MKKFQRKSKPVVNIVYILDSSGSMSGSKFEEGKLGLINEISELVKDPEIQYTFTLVNFSTTVVEECYLLSDYEKAQQIVKDFRLYAGWTALNDAIGMTLTKLIKDIPDGQGVIVSIVTDGEENYSRKYRSNGSVKALLNEAKAKQFTVTFVGTEFDTERAIANFNVERSNTLTHDNTGAGFEKLSKARTASTQSYSRKLKGGMDFASLTDNFYSEP